MGTPAGDALTLVLGVLLLIRPADSIVGTRLLSWLLIIGGGARLAMAVPMWATGRSAPAQPTP